MPACRPTQFGVALGAKLALAACGDTTEQRAATCGLGGAADQKIEKETQ